MVHELIPKPKAVNILEAEAALNKYQSPRC